MTDRPWAYSEDAHVRCMPPDYFEGCAGWEIHRDFLHMTLRQQVLLFATLTAAHKQELARLTAALAREKAEVATTARERDALLVEVADRRAIVAEVRAVLASVAWRNDTPEEGGPYYCAVCLGIGRHSPTCALDAALWPKLATPTGQEKS